MSVTRHANFCFECLQGLHYAFHMSILTNIEDIKRSILERDAAIKNEENEAYEMKRRAEVLIKELDEEKEC